MVDPLPNSATVAWLAENARLQLVGETTRGTAIDTKASWFMAAAGVVLSVVAGMAPDAYGVDVTAAVRFAFTVLYAGALLAIAGSLFWNVRLALWPSSYAAISVTELRLYETPRFYAAEPYEVQGRTLRALVDAVERSRRQNEIKAAGLRRAARSLLVGLTLLLLALATLGIGSLVS